jgi:hypothetical protein
MLNADEGISFRSPKLITLSTNLSKSGKKELDAVKIKHEVFNIIRFNISFAFNKPLSTSGLSYKGELVEHCTTRFERQQVRAKQKSLKIK